MDRSSVRASIARAAALLTVDPGAAEREARAVLAAAPADPGATLVLSSALRRSGNSAAALAIIEPLAKAFPRAATTQFEFGMALADEGRAPEAIAALRASTSLNRENPDAWRALGALLFDAGDANGAEAAFAEHHRALVRDPRLKPAAEALHAGRVADAIAMLGPLAAANPNDLGAAGLLAEAYERRDWHAESVMLLARIVERLPNDEHARLRLARGLFRLQKGAEALAHIERLLTAAPDNPAYRNLAASCRALVGDFEASLAHYDILLREHPQHPKIRANYAQVLGTVGRTDEAVAEFRRSLELDPKAVEAYLGLANLKLVRFTDAEVAAMRRIVTESNLTPADRQQLAFALGKALEDRREFAGSFAHYANGAAVGRGATPYDANMMTTATRRAIRLFTRQFFAERAEHGFEAPDPIFVVGLPRSGSTLIEQILASHSTIEGTAELPDIGFIAQRFPHYPNDLAELTSAEAATLGEEYLLAVQPRRKLGRVFFIDKMPNNFHHLGLIHLILPNAKIIDARRHPMATCFSVFKQHFAQGQAFSYDLADLGHYYRDYVGLMSHFDTVLPGRIHRLIYEDLVEDTEREVRRLLAHLGLEFEPSCLTFFETKRAVQTVSSEQVRRPVFRDGLSQWRNYEPWLGPLREALGDTLEHWRDST
jgi:tetratricopeptide (TPR) repeat protein